MSTSAGSASPALTKLQAGLAAIAATAGGLVYGPLLVQAAIVAVLVAVVVVLGLAHAHGMTVRTAAALYAGRAVLAVAKALAVVAVEWPLRGAHRIWVRFDAPLRAQLGAVRAGEATRDAGLAALARVHPPQRLLAIEAHRAEVLALPPAPVAPAAAVAPAHDTHAA